MFLNGDNKYTDETTKLMALVRKKPLPVHVAIIMDGNGRWAKKRGLHRVAGHRQGVETLRDVIKTSDDLGIKHLTIFAFSTENWKRPVSEVNALIDLLVEYLRKEVMELHSKNVKIVILGCLDAFHPSVRREIERAVELTKDNSGLNINIALNYGGRAEIIRAVKNIIQDVY